MAHKPDISHTSSETVSAFIDPKLNHLSAEVLNNWYETERKGHARHVRINYEMVETVALQCATADFVIPSWHFPNVYPENPHAFVSQMLVGNCFNFAFNIESVPDGKYIVENPGGKPLSGTFAMMAKIYAAFAERGITTEELRRHFDTEEHTMQFFQGINAIPYPELRFATIQDFIRGLTAKQQNPTDLLQEVTTYNQGIPFGLRAFDEGAQRGLVDLLIERFPTAYGADVYTYNKLKFPFVKRAQLAALGLHGRAAETPDREALLLPFVDIESIGPIVDYQVSRTQRAMGMLEYSTDLAVLVDNWREVPEGSGMEIEIRAACAATCNTLLNSVNTKRAAAGLLPINIAHLDYWLWAQSRSHTSTRQHLTRTSAY